MTQTLLTSGCPISYNTADYMADIIAAVASVSRRKVFAFDIETVAREGFGSDQNTNPRFADAEWVSVATQDGEWDWPIKPGTSPVQFLEKFFFSPDYLVLCHNAAFEFKFIISWYWRKKKIWKVPKCKYICTQRASWMANENRKRHNLKELTEDLLERDVIRYEEALVAKNSLWDFWKWRQYSRDDSRNAFDLWFKVFKPAIEADAKHAKVFYEIELPNILPVAEQEVLGIKGDEALVDKYRKEKTLQLQQVEKEIYKKAGRIFNIGSPKQLVNVLFGVLKIPKKGLPRGKDGTPSTSDLVLRELADAGFDICEMLMRHRKITKELSGFWKQLKVGVRTGKGFFYPSARTTNQYTGRWDFKNPTLSTLPNPGKSKSRAREIIRARRGYKLVGGDWSQAELRIMAHVSRDPTLIRVYKDDLDLHEMTSKRVGCSRDHAKELNFGLLYGMGPNGLQRNLRKKGIKLSLEQCRKYVRKFFKAYPGIKEYHRRQAARVQAQGFVRNPLGRIRQLKEAYLFNPGSSFRKAANSPVQSFVADWMKLAYRNIRARAVKEGVWGPKKFHLLFTVHDELIGECPEAMAERCRQMMQEEMENVVKIRVPIKADVKIADSWYGFKEKKAA